jgi:hypothetical protein
MVAVMVSPTKKPAMAVAIAGGVLPVVFLDVNPPARHGVAVTATTCGGGEVEVHRHKRSRVEPVVKRLRRSAVNVAPKTHIRED